MKLRETLCNSPLVFQNDFLPIYSTIMYSEYKLKLLIPFQSGWDRDIVKPWYEGIIQGHINTKNVISMNIMDMYANENFYFFVYLPFLKWFLNFSSGVLVHLRNQYMWVFNKFNRNRIMWVYYTQYIFYFV